LAAWIAEAEQQRAAALANRPAEHSPAERNKDAIETMTAQDIAFLAAESGDIAAALADATPEHKLDLYRSLRLRAVAEA
jgi:site-specific DNA recombinase